jgi:hypothetical protein
LRGSRNPTADPQVDTDMRRKEIESPAMKPMSSSITLRGVMAARVADEGLRAAVCRWRARSRTGGVLRGGEVKSGASKHFPAGRVSGVRSLLSCPSHYVQCEESSPSGGVRGARAVGCREEIET